MLRRRAQASLSVQLDTEVQLVINQPASVAVFARWT